MAENQADPDDRPRAGTDVDLAFRDHGTARDHVDALIDRARVRIMWIGPGRVAGAVGSLLVIAGIGWWLLRSPSLPTEAALPAVTHAAEDAPTTTGPGALSTVTLVAVADSAAPAIVVVHVTGAVNQPGVYELAAGERVDDALAAAGGATTEADPNALNLAAPVADGDRIEVPVIGGDQQVGSAVGSGHTHATAPSSGDAAGEPVDLNEATAADLERLPGIGPATASAIVEYRAQSGPFSSVDQLLDVPGIGPAKLDAIRDAVTT